VRNANGEMVPLGSADEGHAQLRPGMVVRYNGFTAADINGGPAPGYSSARRRRRCRAHRRRDAAAG
jgi:multidrug efflux pump